ncbi:hypothetical protein LTR04_002079, partial [Oleoguttula sp. CCFEE 6159]
QKLVADLRNVIEKAKILTLTKNEGNLLQDFIWQTQNISGANASKPNAPIDKSTAQQHGNEVLDGLRTLGTLIISNGQFRKLLSDATILLRDMAGDAAQTAANKVNPSEDELNQIDRPAEDNTWHDVPNLDKDHLKNQVKGKINEQKPFGRGDLKKAAGDATQSAHPSGSRDPADAADLAARDQQDGTNSGMDAQQGARAGYQSLKDQASQNVPDETKDRVRERRDKANNYLKEKLPQERRDQAIFRLKKMVVEIQGHHDYQQAIDTLLRLAEEYTGHTKNVAQQTSGTVKGAHGDNALQTAETDLKTLIERFANSTSTDDLFDSINAVYRDADRDPELKGWFRHMNQYVRKCLKQQGYILRDEATEEWNKLYDQGEFLLRDRYRNHTDRVVDEIKFLTHQFDEDEQNKAFGQAMQKLFLDLGNDENGKPTFKPHLLKDLSEVILPGIFTSIRYVPIPRVEYSDPMIDAIVENLVIEGDNLAPNVFEFATDNHWRWGRKSIPNKHKNKVMLSVSGIQMDLKDVSYYVKKKQGFPSVTDKGVMDIFLGGSGLSFKVAMETADKTDQSHFFKVNTVTVDIKNMNIKLKQSNHKLLFNLFKPILFGVLKPVITKVVEKVVKDNIHQLDGMAYEVQKEVKRAEADAKNNPDPENIQNIYQRYVSAAQKKLMQGKKKTEDVAADKKVNMAITQQDSIFKNIALPGGISTKATEYKELARKGDKWESPVFSIGSARETTNLPKIPAVQRKPHRVNKEGVRGPQNVSEEHSSTSYGQDSGYGQRTGYDQDAGYGQGAGYGQDAGYGQSPGYGQTTGSEQYARYDAGYGQNTNATYGASNVSSGFSNQVNQAFDGNAGYASKLEPVINGSTGHTLLGTHNLVLTGSV